MMNNRKQRETINNAIRQIENMEEEEERCNSPNIITYVQYMFVSFGVLLINQIYENDEIAKTEEATMIIFIIKHLLGVSSLELSLITYSTSQYVLS